MGVPGKTLLIKLRVIVAEIVKQQERVELARVLKAEGAVQMHPGALHRGLGGAGLEDGTQGHRGASFRG